MSQSPWWKRILFAPAVFFFDFFVIYLCAFFFLAYTCVSTVFPNLDIAGWFWVIPSLVLCLALVLACRVLCRLAGGSGSRAGRVVEGVFFGFFALAGLCASVILARTALHIQSFPKSLLLFAVFAGLVLAWLMPRRLVWRKAPFFFALLVCVCVYFIGMVKNYVSETDFLPVEAPGVKVVARIENPVAYEPGAPRNAAWDFSVRWMQDFVGMVVGMYQYSYLALSADNQYLYVNDFNLLGNAGHLFKVRLDDFSVVARVNNPGPYRDMIEDPESGQLIATSFLSEEVRYYRASDLELTGRVDVGTTAVLNIVQLPNRNLVVTSEPARMMVINPEREIIRRHVLPIQLEDIALDETGRFLIVSAIGGCTVTVLDLETMETVRRRCLPLGAVDVSFDARGGRIVLPITFGGSVKVLDYGTLETLAAIPLAPGIRPVCYVPDRDLIVVGNYLSGELHFIDGRSYRLLKTIWGGTRIRDIQYAPLRQRLYVCASLYVLEIDLETLLGKPAREG